MTTAATTWPDAARLSRISTLIVEAYNALDEAQLDYWRIANEVDALGRETPLPTFEELGRLSAFVTCLTTDLEGMSKHLAVVREAHDAAAARLQDAARLEADDAR